MPTHHVPVKLGDGTIVNVASEDLGGGLWIEVTKIHVGGLGIDGGPVADDNPFPVAVISSPSTPAAGVALDGADIAAPSAMPTGGSGIRGWLSAIYTALVATIVADLGTILARIPTPGQKTMAGSAPVAIASDQPTIPVAGVVAVSNLPATQAVSATALPLPAGAATDAAIVALAGKLGTLGQKTMAGSAPVVIASDQPAIPVTGAITTNVGGITPLFPVVAFSRPANVLAYATGNVMAAATTGGANYLTLANCVRVNGGTGTIVGVMIEDSARNSPTPILTLFLYSAPPAATVNDNVAYNPTTDEDNLACPPIVVSTFTPLSTNGILSAAELFRPFQCGGAVKDLYLVVVMSGANYTPSNAETFRIKLFVTPDA